MTYTFTGIPAPIKVAAPKKRELPIPAFRTPTGLQAWWRPVAVGFPTTGTSASYVGPRPAAPGRHVGVEAASMIPDYFPQYRGATFVRGKETPPSAEKYPTGSNVIVTASGLIELPPGAWINPFNPANVPGGNI